MTVLTHQIRLDLNNVQRTWFERCAGAARFVYNWGLAEWKRQYEADEKPSRLKLNRQFNVIKKIEFPWITELPWMIPNRALFDLGHAFSEFFRRVKAGKKPGYPKFKKKGRSREAFSVNNRRTIFKDRRVRVPKLGWVRTRQEIRFPGRVTSVRFIKRANHWYVSVQVEIDESKWSYPHRCETQAAVGVDLGVVDLAVLSNGERVPAPRSLRRYEKRLRMLNKELSRRTKGGKNWRKTKAKLARLHEHIANIRQDVTHKLTAQIVRNFRFIGIEDLCVKGMARTRLAKSVMDTAMAEVTRQLDYKAPLADSFVVTADRWYPSSKTCSACGVIYANLVLGERRWTCDACGAHHDRDDNAAENLKQLAAAHAATVCCPGSAGLPRKTKLPAGQESSNYVNLG